MGGYKNKRKKNPEVRSLEEREKTMRKKKNGALSSLPLFIAQFAQIHSCSLIKSGFKPRLVWLTQT